MDEKREWEVVAWDQEKKILTTRESGRYQDFWYRDFDKKTGQHLIDVWKHFGDHEYESGGLVEIPGKYSKGAAILLGPVYFYAVY